MVCSPLPFQHGLSFGTFIARFGTEELCVRALFLAMHLLTQGKHSISALELKRQIGVSHETAWKVKQKLLQVMLEREMGRILYGRVEVDDAYMGGERHGGTRGRGASEKTPLIAAVQTNQEEDPSKRKMVYLKLQAVPDFKGRTVKQWAQQSLDPASTVLTDGLSSFSTIGEVILNRLLSALVRIKAEPGRTHPYPVAPNAKKAPGGAFSMKIR